MADLILPDEAHANDPGHITDHNQIVTAIQTVNTAVEAVETELGSNPSGTYSTVVARLNSIDTAARHAPTTTALWEDTHSAGGALPATGWVRADVAGKSAYIEWSTTANCWIARCGISADGSPEMHCLLYPRALAIGETLQGGYRTFVKANHVLGGPCVTDGAAGANMIAATLHAPRTFSIRTFTNLNTQVSDIGNLGAMSAIEADLIHVRLSRTASTSWAMTVSIDGEYFFPWTTHTYSITPSHLGWTWSSWGGTNTGYAALEYLRVI